MLHLLSHLFVIRSRLLRLFQLWLRFLQHKSLFSKTRLHWLLLSFQLQLLLRHWLLHRLLLFMQHCLLLLLPL
jgi:hypothetical protein